jgi:hypothetical protein
VQEEERYVVVGGGGRGVTCVRGVERPVSLSDDVKEHGEWVDGTCAAQTFEHVIGEVVDVVSLAVIAVQENLNMFPGCQYSVGLGPSPSRMMFEYRADCNRHIAFTLT